MNTDTPGGHIFIDEGPPLDDETKERLRGLLEGPESYDEREADEAAQWADAQAHADMLAVQRGRHWDPYRSSVPDMDTDEEDY